MPSTPSAVTDIRLPLSGQRLISLRPVGGHAALRRAAARHGLKVLALSPWTLVQYHDDATRAALDAAMHAGIVLVTSPAAVDAACGLCPLSAVPVWIAVGTGTAQRLRRAGIEAVITPERMDSEGLLTLPLLQQLHGQRVGLITAPGGRGLIAPTLAQRGAALIRADVYARVPVTPASSALARLAGPDPLWLALSSQAALATVLARLPAASLQRLRTARVVAASERLAQYAQAHGFAVAAIADDARPASLVRALVTAANLPASRSR